VTNDVVIGADDEACIAAYQMPHTRCIVPNWLFTSGGFSHHTQKLDDNVTGSASYGSSSFIKLQRMKTRPVLEVLALGYHVLYTDLDVYWAADPREWLLARAALDMSWDDADRQYTRGADGGNMSVAFDLLIQSDFVPWNARPCGKDTDCRKSFRCGISHSGSRGRVCAPEANAGFYFMRSSDASRAFVRELQRMYAHRGTPRDMTEQPVFNKVLASVRRQMTWQLLPVQLFTNGWAYRGRRVRPPIGAMPFIVHHNWMSGGLHKRTRMKDWGMWALADDASGSDQPVCMPNHAATAVEKSRTGK